MPNKVSATNNWIRVIMFWMTALSLIWYSVYVCAAAWEKGQAWYEDSLSAPFLSDLDMKGRTKALLMAICPLLMISCVSLLLMTDVSFPHPGHISSWFQKMMNVKTPFRLADAEEARSIATKNQFGVGDINFNYASFVFVVVPSCLFLMATIHRVLINNDDDDDKMEPERKLAFVADLFGLTGTVVLSFFLIPVSRHSVVLVAMGWSPVHALRFHIWSGFTAYIYIMSHGILYVVEWFMYQEGRVGDLLFPDKECFKFTEEEYSDKCKREWYNFTGVIGILAYTLLCVTSLNWFRRRNYRLFYLFHICSATVMMLAALAHWRTFIVYLLPSLLYYTASTTPTLLQALASRFRGGIKIVKVVFVPDAGGCVEVQIAASPEASANLATSSCYFVKLCVPKISVVWHPFTVYQQPEDLSTVRFLFRPVGPFTKALSKSFTEEANNRPVTIVDGLYRGGDRAMEALRHDDVTIIAGGVAMTPFLSMLCQLLATLKNSINDANNIHTRSVTVIWTCRERGLISFVQKNFLVWMLKQAKDVRHICPEFEFSIKIYFTGRDSTDDSTKSMHHSSTSNISGEDDDDDGPAKKDDPKTLDDRVHAFQESEDEHDANIGKPIMDLEEMDPKDKLDIPGTPFRLAHMMPGKSSKVLHNSPMFLVFSLMLWLGFYIMFRWYQFREYTTNPIAERLWGFIIGTAAMVGIALIYECVMAWFERSFPPDCPEPFPVDKPSGTCTGASAFSSHTSGMKDDDCEEGRKDSGAADNRSGARLEINNGRPNFSEYFEMINGKASCPGFFVCGPVAMSRAVKKEADKGNSKWGKTRFCLYEEPFEM